MRIAYLILCHTDPDHIKRLTDKITDRTGDEAFVHVDGKCDVRPFAQALQENPHVHLTPRVPVYWGGYSAIEATILLFRTALAHAGPPFDRFVILQGGLSIRYDPMRQSTPFLKKTRTRNLSLPKIFPKAPTPKRSTSTRCTGIWTPPTSGGSGFCTRSTVPCFWHAVTSRILSTVM